MRLSNLMKDMEFGYPVKIVSQKTGNALIREIRADDKKLEWFGKLNVSRIHCTIEKRSVGYAQITVACCASDSEFSQIVDDRHPEFEAAQAGEGGHV